MRVRDEALAAEGLDAREQVSRRLGVLAPRRLHDVDAHRVGGHATRLVLGLGLGLGLGVRG